MNTAFNLNKKSDVRVSVVIPTHNRGNLIEKSVRSAMKQTHTNLEIIVISDGSLDNTDEVMEKLMQEDSRIKFFSYYPSKGANEARNMGILKSKFEYVAFLDDDDQWFPDKLEKQLEIFSKDLEIGLVCGGINAIYVDQNTESVFIPPAKRDSSKDILIRNCIGSTTTVVVKKELFAKSGMFDVELQALQDYDLWIRLCQHTKVGVLKEPCVKYYHYPNSNQISRDTYKYINAVGYIEKKHSKLLHSLNIEERKERKNVFMLLLSKKGIKNGEKKLAFKYSVRALQHKINKQAIICLTLSILPFNDFMLLRKYVNVLRKSLKINLI